MEIIKHGKTYKAAKEMTCPDCDCIFTYKDTDVKQNWVRIIRFYLSITYTYIICPECHKTIIIKGFRK